MKTTRPSVYTVNVRRKGQEDYFIQGVHETREGAEHRCEALNGYDWVGNAFVNATLLYR